MSLSKLPYWEPPNIPNKDEVSLSVYNSLTRSKVRFEPVNNGIVRWYTCGPTVYDAAHMGHARTYITFDIIRRIMVDYFHFNVNYVMNITDIDDKIIVRAQIQYLMVQYQKEHIGLITNQVITDAKKALQYYANVHFNKTADDLFITLNGQDDDMPKSKVFITLYNAIHSAASEHVSSLTVENFTNTIQDIFGPYLCYKHGDACTDHTIYKAFSSNWEKQFNHDMALLNVLPPTIMTRVSDYIPEIIAYISQIIGKGYAYVTTFGAVYFSVDEFRKKFPYPRLSPWNFDTDKMHQVSNGSNSHMKKDMRDFVLWKESKPGEPYWESPWGKGRPGWHIECSAMASATLGDKLDIHSGGIDLCFPHHDNELAQAEAYFDLPQWVNYFLHAGHLNIEGQKMSKSLKNFITIKDALRCYTSNQIRWFFLKNQWDKVLDYKDTSMQEAKSTESTFFEFFKNIRARQNNDNDSVRQKASHEDMELSKALEGSSVNVHKALADSFNTPSVIKILLELVSTCNVYMTKEVINNQVLNLCGNYIESMLKLFGLKTSPQQNFQRTEETVQDTPTTMSVLQLLATFRQQVRQILLSENDVRENKQNIIQLCDELRDIHLVELGVEMRDRTNADTPFIALVPKDELVKAREKIIQAGTDKVNQRKKNLEQTSRQKCKVGETPASQLFKGEHGKTLFSEWDDNGIPTHLKSGEAISKNARKKLMKEWEKQSRLHSKYLSQ